MEEGMVFLVDKIICLDHISLQLMNEWMNEGCEQVSNLVRKTVYERVHERVNKHKCVQVSRSEQEWANEQECMINRKNEPVSNWA